MKKKIKQEILPDFQFPLFWDYEDLDDRALDHKLPLELFLRHEGYEVILKGKKYIMRISNHKDSPRDALTLKTFTWKGISSNARHFYGSLIFPSLQFQEYGTNSFCSGYGIPNVPHKVTLHRPLTKQDLLDYPDRYEGCKIGRMVEGFYSTGDIITRAKAVIKEYFPNFKLNIPKQDS